MATVSRDSLCELGPLLIPRPKCVGMQFVSVRGRYGFYQSVNKSAALKYGLVQQKGAGSRRPALPEHWTEGGELNGKGTIPEEPELEPSPDYEETGTGENEQRQRPAPAADRIAVPSGRAPPAPPLSAQMRQTLLELQQRFQNGLFIRPPKNGGRENGKEQRQQVDLPMADANLKGWPTNGGLQQQMAKDGPTALMCSVRL